MTLARRLQALEALLLDASTDKGRLGLLLERHWKAGTLPPRVKELLCLAIARSPKDAPAQVIDALLAAEDVDEHHKDLLTRRRRGELLAWREN